MLPLPAITLKQLQNTPDVETLEALNVVYILKALYSQQTPENGFDWLIWYVIMICYHCIKKLAK